ncbi:hypothetical protein [Sphingomonas sp.]|uniref:hypothetical protein n=1 Tax=Sphingomonas sp. TaxID=28214 RepID=UPI003CC5125D
MTLWLAMAAFASQVVLTTPPAARSGLAAYPRIARPVTEPATRINAAVARLDARGRAAAADCMAAGEERRGSWNRTVTATMRGPDFVSFLVTDDYDCGGAHPNLGHAAIVYDLATGMPVDWTRLLPHRLTGTIGLTDDGDGVQMVTLSSPRLTALYRRGYRPGYDDRELNAQCRAAIAGDGGDAVAMLAWLDGKAGGLVLQYDLPHVMQACSAPVTVSLGVLQREGAGLRLVRALRAARAAERRR